MKQMEFGKKEEKYIKFKGYHRFTLYPKYPSILGENGVNYGITKWHISEMIEGELHPDCRWSDITVTGNFYFPLDSEIEYTVLAKEIEHKTYGIQYAVLSVHEDIDFTNMDNQIAFLKEFLKPGQIQELYQVYEDPLGIIAEHDVEKLMKVKGIGPYIADAILRRFDEKKDLAPVFIALDGLGLTGNFVSKLMQRYKSAPVVVNKIKKRPYDLIFEVDGVGFKTADSIALKGEIEPKSPERIKGFIYYLLNTKAQEGNSFLYASELTEEIFTEFGGKDEIMETYYNEDGEAIGNNISKAIDDLVNSGLVIKEENGDKLHRRIYLKKYYDLERKIARHLKRLLLSPNLFKYDKWEDDIKKQEEEQGWNFTEEQKDGIKLGLDKQVCFITGGAGCVDADTEFFDGTGWKRIADYIMGDKVLQYEDGGKATLVSPSNYIKEPCDELWHFETKYGTNQTICDNHRIIYWTAKNKKRECTISDIIEAQNNPYSGWRGRFETVFQYDGKGIDLSDAQIRLMCAIIADGSFYSNATTERDSWNTCRFHIKKERKKQRLRYLFKLNKLEWRETPSQNIGYTDFYIVAPRREKQYESYWYNCTNHQLQIVCDEVLHWDGSFKTPNHMGVSRKSFSTTVKQTADFVQFAFSACGYRVAIRVRDRVGKTKILNDKEYIRQTLEYELNVTERHFVGLNSDIRQNQNKTIPYKVPTVDGYKYCFTVPSGMLVLRREGQIFITGNCGKSSLVSGILTVLKHYNFAQCSLSGKAAARLKEVTGKDGSTIHRLLGYRPGLGFTFNRENPLPYDIIIVDEISLIGGEIFLSLLEAIPNGTKLFVLGDMGQLESIGCMNLAADMYASDTIPTKTLTKIHRQAQKSGIITTSLSVRRGEQLFNSSFEGQKTMGELQDMIVDIVPKEDVVQTTLEYFEKYYAEVDGNIMDIQLISPVKERGDSCVYCLNKEIQSRINPKRGSSKEITITLSEDKSFCIRKDDKVLCTKNIYGIRTLKDEETDIFNGWTGIVTNVRDNDITIYFPLAGEEVILSNNDIYENITLGYAITCHKMQGASAKVIIGVLDFSTPPKMLTKELLYTMITRAEKIGVIVGQNRAIAKAIENSGISDKKTFLQELLVITEEDYKAKEQKEKKQKQIIEALLNEEDVPTTMLSIDEMLNAII